MKSSTSELGLTTGLTYSRDDVICQQGEDRKNGRRVARIRHNEKVSDVL